MNDIKENSKIKNAFKEAFPYTLPICAGFIFLGLAYGIYMRSAGFSAIFPIIMSITIFAGSMEFVAVNLLIGEFHPLNAFLLTLMVNARHLFYGLSMLDKYNIEGKKKIYLIFGMCDESFSINCSTNIPKNVDKAWFMFFVTLLNHIYWVSGATLGGLLGDLFIFNLDGLEFVMTALFIVIFLEQWNKERKHYSALIGLCIPFICLIIFGSENFMIPSMISILGVLLFFRGYLDSEGLEENE